MRNLFSIYFILLAFALIQRSQSRHLEIIYKGGDCVCAQPGLKSGCEGSLPPVPLLPTTNGNLNVNGCNRPRYRVRPMNNHIKYIYDYDVEIPIEPKKINIPLTDLFAKVDKILIESDSPRVVNSDCTCSKVSAVTPCQVHSAQCPVHSARSYGNQQHGIARYLDKVTSSFPQVSKDSVRVYKKVPPNIFNKVKTKEGKQKIRKRDVSEVNYDSSAQEAFLNIQRVHLLPTSSYFSDKIQSDGCFSCFLSPNRGDAEGRELFCNPGGASCCAGKAYQEPSINTGINLSTYPGAPWKALPAIPNEKLTDPQLRSYMKGVLHSHDDFFAAMDSKPMMSTPVQSQEAAAQQFLQRLMQDQNQAYTGSDIII